jgi:hypothetical protein
MDLSLILGVLKEGLKLWNTKEGTKYLDRVIKLEKQYYEELSKPELERSQLYLDERLRELNRIAENFVSYRGPKS